MEKNSAMLEITQSIESENENRTFDFFVMIFIGVFFCLSERFAFLLFSTIGQWRNLQSS